MFTIVTFPFLFGMMFGDIMHGSILLTFGSWLVFANKTPGSLAHTMGDGKWILLLMGIFATFCGLIYNDFTSMGTMLFGASCWSEEGATKVGNKVMLKRTSKDCVYPFGIDYTWYRSNEEITYLNSFKMKTSVIFGVLQMQLGTLLKCANALYNDKMVDFVFEGVSQFTMMTVMFGFMDYLIFVKWLTDYDPIMAEGYDPPSIINSMVNMFLTGGKAPEVAGKKGPADLIGNQQAIMQSFVVIAFSMVPLMLLVKPLIELFKSKPAQVDDEIEMPTVAHKQALMGESQQIGDSGPISDEDTVLEPFKKHGDHDHGFGDLLIHCMIETIEYALGTVSNTASYLRLWALSLAHSQLSKVFFDLTLGQTL